MLASAPCMCACLHAACKPRASPALTPTSTHAHLHTQVRAAALDVLRSASSQLQGHAAGKEAAGKERSAAAALAPLLAALLDHAALVAADADAVVTLMRNTFAEGGGPPEPAQATPSKPKKGKQQAGRAAKASQERLRVEGGAAAVDAAFAQLAQMLDALSAGWRAGGRGDRAYGAHIARTLLLGMVQEAGGADGEGAVGTQPVAATAAQRQALLPHALELLQVSTLSAAKGLQGGLHFACLPHAPCLSKPSDLAAAAVSASSLATRAWLPSAPSAACTFCSRTWPYPLTPLPPPFPKHPHPCSPAPLAWSQTRGGRQAAFPLKPAHPPCPPHHHPAGARPGQRCPFSVPGGAAAGGLARGLRVHAR